MNKTLLKLVKIKGGLSLWCKTTITFLDGKKKQIHEWFVEKPIINENKNCECKEPEPDDSVDSLGFGGRFSRCKTCQGRVWN